MWKNFDNSKQVTMRYGSYWTPGGGSPGEKGSIYSGVFHETNADKDCGMFC